MRTLALLSLATMLLAGCGHDTTVTVGEPGQKGVIRRDIDKSREVAGIETARKQSDDAQ